LRIRGLAASREKRGASNDGSNCRLQKETAWDGFGPLSQIIDHDWPSSTWRPFAGPPYLKAGYWSKRGLRAQPLLAIGQLGSTYRFAVPRHPADRRQPRTPSALPRANCVSWRSSSITHGVRPNAGRLLVGPASRWIAASQPSNGTQRHREHGGAA